MVIGWTEQLDGYHMQLSVAVPVRRDHIWSAKLAVVRSRVCVWLFV